MSTTASLSQLSTVVQKSCQKAKQDQHVFTGKNNENNVASLPNRLMNLYLYLTQLRI